MQKSHAPDSSDYAKAITTLVTAMPVERAAEVYDFARFLRSRVTPLVSLDLDDDDWLDDSEEQMQAEDALWEAASNRQRDQFAALADAARAEIAAGTTQPVFDEHLGHWMLQPHRRALDPTTR